MKALCLFLFLLWQICPAMAQSPPPAKGWTVEHVRSLYQRARSEQGDLNPPLSFFFDCLRREFLQRYTVTEFLQLSDSAFKKAFERSKFDCVMGRNPFGTHYKSELQSRVEKQDALNDYAGMEASLTELLLQGEHFDFIQANISLGFAQLCLKKYKKAKAAFDFALAESKDSALIEGNIANYYLLTGNYEKALPVYKKYLGRELEDERLFDDAVSDDLREFERLGLPRTNFMRLRKDLHIDWETTFSNSSEKGAFKTIRIDPNLDTSIFNILSEEDKNGYRRAARQDDTNTVFDWRQNRARFRLQTVDDNELVRQPAINRKSGSCHCYYEGDTFFIQVNLSGGSDWFGPREGLGMDIEIIGNQFHSRFFRYNLRERLFRNDTNTGPDYYVLCEQADQELILLQPLSYKSNQHIRGILKFRTHPFFLTGISEEQEGRPRMPVTVKEVFQGAIVFQCNRLHTRTVTIKGNSKRPDLEIKAPFHYFDLQMPKRAASER